MEQISRLTTRNVDILLIVSDTSRRGLTAGLRINELAHHLNIGVQKSYLIMNQVKGDPAPGVMEIIKAAGVELAGTIPEDVGVYDFDLNGRPTIDLSEENPAVKAAFNIFDRIIT